MKYITQKQLSEKLEPINLQVLIAQETNGRMRIRLLALSHIKDGADRAQTGRHSVVIMDVRGGIQKMLLMNLIMLAS
ncbi:MULTISPECIES: hypothetical protein [unclassified Colwellia]|uniref:hypothetical protein n=1 Tax=unclassified Colwellia TaxID=196834 RepID=UPI0015F622FC|nr:hypothetical protein [Colwellia sp. MB02u-7]MBA6235765.1 hypothetical protein [Colwellia sp. MB02u-11]MBA6254991.1 hypothetical protein [Colwellia sp. MB3u-28]MBA6259058.1 hypothetical protein [Colwellia sp. MB3u-41]MBA6298854.1 hypothetical protein [Colwellia sp. MB3u-22]MBA6302134.1 hypothetical protein [Colwellia sp. MB02u-14]MBA6309858.1 hypothetical protein [Colwellia sp. MB3u-64]